MELRNLNILLISPEPWDHIFVSKHHYAVQLASEGNQVFFLNPPDDEWRIYTTRYKRLFSVHYRGFPKGLRFYPRFIQNLFIRRNFAKVEKSCKVAFDVIWSFDNSVFFDFGALPDRVTKICHIVDQNQNFQLARAASTADLCIGVIPSIVEKLLRYNKNTFLITHGVQEFPTNPVGIDLPGKNQKKALYLGNLDMPYINWPLLLMAAKQLDSVDFVFVGPIEKSKEAASVVELQKLTNVAFLPAVPASAIPGYLASADVLLIAYKMEYNYQYASPHKTMEYLASGKMIVSTRVESCIDLAALNLLLMENEDEGFVELVRKALDQRQRWSSPEVAQKRIGVALENSYKRKLLEINKFLTVVRHSKRPPADGNY